MRLLWETSDAIFNKLNLLQLSNLNYYPKCNQGKNRL